MRNLIVEVEVSVDGGMGGALAQEDYVRMLVKGNEKLVADATKARDAAGEADDQQTQDLMVNRITIHQKTIWMLKSCLKG